MTSSSSSKDAAINTANEAYASAREYIEGIDEEAMLRPNRVGVWSGKDLLVHIADWETIGARILDDLAAGRPEAWIPEGMDGNTFNEQRVAELADMSIADAMAYWEESHEKLIQTYAESDGQREDILLGLTHRHYRGHMPDFRHVKPFKALTDADRDELIAKMDAAHADYLELINSVSDEKLVQTNTVGIWSGKDLIAHLGHWQQAAIDLTRELEQDRPGKWPGEDGNNINEWNEEKVEEMRSLDLDETRAYQQERYDELRGLMGSSPFATRAAGIGATEFHYGLHREDFERMQ